MRIIGALSQPWADACIYFCRLDEERYTEEINRLAKSVSLNSINYSSIIYIAVRTSMLGSVTNQSDIQKLQSGSIAGVICDNGYCTADDEDIEYSLYSLQTNINKKTNVRDET